VCQQIPHNNLPRKNVILAALPIDAYNRVLSKLNLVPLELGQVLYEAGEVIKNVYFPISGLVSLVRIMSEKVTVEVGVIGSDGMVGFPVFLGDDIAFEKTIVQMAGEAMKMSSRALKVELKLPENSLLNQLLSFTRRHLKQVAQTAACNRVHSIEQRLSRWMLMCRDRMETDDLQLTHEFISNMLGTRREGVSTAAAVLQRRGLIRYSRGNVNILDRKSLEAFSCECYSATQDGNHSKAARK
jgi:CRP-like cAMP-binding protein